MQDRSLILTNIYEHSLTHCQTINGDHKKKISSDYIHLNNINNRILILSHFDPVDSPSLSESEMLTRAKNG